jgi:hypothetical protein
MFVERHSDLDASPLSEQVDVEWHLVMEPLSALAGKWDDSGRSIKTFSLRLKPGIDAKLPTFIVTITFI